MVNKIEESVTKHGNASGFAQCTPAQEESFLKVVLESGVDNINMMSLFSLAKRPAIVPDREPLVPPERPMLPMKRVKTDELENTLNASILEDSVSKSTEEQGESSAAEAVKPVAFHKPIPVRIPMFIK